MSKKSITTLLLVCVLIMGTTFTVHASAEPNTARSLRSWEISSFPGNDNSATAYDLKESSDISVYTHNYRSEPHGGQVIYVSSPQSPDRPAINSTGIKYMSYNQNVKKGDRIEVNFYAYSSTDRIMADGTIDG